MVLPTLSCLLFSPIVSPQCACVGWCLRLPALLDGVSVFPCLPACPPACLSQVSQLKLSHAENCADSKVHRASGLRIMAFFTFIFRCFHRIQLFDSPMLLDSSVWIQIVGPPSDVSFIVFWHLALQQSKRSRTKQTYIKWSPALIADIFTIPVAVFHVFQITS